MVYEGPSLAAKANGATEIFFEDCTVGRVFESMRSYVADRDEMIAMAQKWDPLVFHIDEEEAKKSVVGRLFASSRYTLAVSSWLLNQQNPMIAIAAAMQLNKMRLPRPVFPGDLCCNPSSLLILSPYYFGGGRRRVEPQGDVLGAGRSADQAEGHGCGYGALCRVQSARQDSVGVGGERNGETSHSGRLLVAPRHSFVAALRSCG